MNIKVKFRFNKVTGEVEEFEVGQESSLPSAEHNRRHDQVAAEIGRFVERDARIDEHSPGAAAPRLKAPPAAATDARVEAPEAAPEARTKQKK